MSKQKTPSEKDNTDVEKPAKAPPDASNVPVVAAEQKKQGPAEETQPKIETETSKQSKPPKSADRPQREFPWFGLFNFLLIIGIVAAAGYYWQMQQQLEQDKRQTLSSLQQQLAGKAEETQVQRRLAPLEQGASESLGRLDQLQQQQQALQESTEKLYELYGRDESGWQLAEVEYLMRVAQHKLILENDFEGAAITLQAASDRIAATADPGLLPVRVQISDEIAVLKTRARPDLVGMTLVLSQLSRQIRALTPGYLPRIDSGEGKVETDDTNQADQTLDERVVTFFSSLVSIKKDESLPTQTEALVVDIEQTLEDSLKLTRWTVLERDNFQYRRLMQDNVRLFKQYYDLDNAPNYDFYSQLLDLQKATVKPEKPDISGSLELLKRIMKKREIAPQQTESVGGDNG